MGGVMCNLLGIECGALLAKETRETRDEANKAHKTAIKEQSGGR